MRNALKRVVLLIVAVTFTLLLPPTNAIGSQAGSSTASDSAVSSGKETIVIRADRAWEEADGSEVLHFAGNFELISPEWELRSDEADLFGPLDDPTRIVARGAPAYLTILDEERTIEGEGLVIEYQRDQDVLILRQDAKHAAPDISKTSSEIVFDLAEERERASGPDGVETALERARKSPAGCQPMAA